MKPEGKAGIQKLGTCSSLEVDRGAKRHSCLAWGSPGPDLPAQLPLTGCHRIFNTSSRLASTLCATESTFGKAPGWQAGLLWDTVSLSAKITYT